ncbi:MAG TPA: prepilin-type N-terminal cleavage/methylation domain-containing protein [bacterium]|nr:prepilin-type N-terminal cleavage/methylation domain-containing protein [bacterium]
MERSLMGATDPCAWRRRNPERSQRGLTLMELVVVLSIIAVLVALALPRYIIPRKNAYKMEAVNILQELKTMEWAYYQQWNAFTSDVTSAGLAMPNGSHWATPLLYTFSPGYIVFGMYGTVAPMAWSNIVYVTLSSDGSATESATF